MVKEPNRIEVVRCGQCIHQGSRLDTPQGNVLVGCYLMKPDDFCSHGERIPTVATSKKKRWT